MIDEKLPVTVLPIYEESYPVFSFLLDPLKRLSIPAAFGILGDAAGRDAARRGWGYKELTDRNQAWVLIRAKMVIERQPSWGEEIILRTWPKLMEGIVAYRDFQILDGQRNVLMAGSTAWTILDLATRKPVRLGILGASANEYADYHAIPDKPVRINWPDDLNVAQELTAEYGHLDMNNHVNNSRYIEWVINTLPPEVLWTRKIKAVEVNFISEVKHMDQLQIRVPASNPDKNIFQGFIVNIEDKRQVFAARITLA
jgi:acyl-ACP thioesterase